MPLASVKLLSPVANPGKIVCAPVNYQKHLDEVRDDAPAWSRSVADETSKRVREAVQSLPPRDREVIVLRYFEQLTPAQIAGVTRQSTNAVDVRLHRARAKLASALAEWREAQ